MLRCVPVARVIAECSAFARSGAKVWPRAAWAFRLDLELVNLVGKRAPGPRKSQVDKMGGSRCRGGNMLNA